VILIFLLVVAGCQTSTKKASFEASPVWGTFSSADADAANNEVAEATVFVASQWHLSPSVSTKIGSPKRIPQEENQVALYNQIAAWVQNKGLRFVIVEGCEGEIEDSFDKSFNGWSLQDLGELQESERVYIMTHIGLKLKARFKQKLRVICGDSEKLIKDHLLALSDLRGLLGFRMRLESIKKEKPDQLESYLVSVRKVVGLSSNENYEVVIRRIEEEMRKSFQRYQTLINERNQFFVKAAERHRPAVIVVGALHVENLKAELEKEGTSVAIYTPKGLVGDEGNVMKQFEKLLQKQSLQ